MSPHKVKIISIILSMNMIQPIQQFLSVQKFMALRQLHRFHNSEGKFLQRSKKRKKLKKNSKKRYVKINKPFLPRVMEQIIFKSSLEILHLTNLLLLSTFIWLHSESQGL